MKFKQICLISIGVILTGFTSNVLASGFYIPLMSAAQLGVGFAGGAASAEDASTNYYNAAGLVMLPQQQMVFSAIGAFSHVTFSGSSTSTGLPAPFSVPFSASGSTGTHIYGVVPAFHYSAPICNKLFFGFSATVPYGLGESYPADAPFRYDLVNANAMALDMGPSLAYAVTDQFSVGLGFDALYFGANFQSMVRTEPATFADASTTEDIAGWGYGWHGGLLYQFTPATRAGISYRSKIVDHLRGTSQFDTGASGFFTPGAFASDVLRTKINFPPLTKVSLYHDVTSQWAVMGTVELMQWSVYRNIQALNVAGLAGTLVPVVNSPQFYHDTWRYALGTSYKLNSEWMIRGGINYDQGATNNVFRDMEVIDGDSIGLDIGAHYQPWTNIGFDAAYGHGFPITAPLNYVNSVAGTTTTVTGSATTVGDSLGLQMEWNV